MKNVDYFERCLNLIDGVVIKDSNVFNSAAVTALTLALLANAQAIKEQTQTEIRIARYIKGEIESI